MLFKLGPILGRIYTVIFICLMLFAFWYQKKYLEKASKEFHAQLNAKNFILPTSTLENFVTKTYHNGALRYFLSGDKIIYFTDGHFEAQGHLVYKDFNINQKDPIIMHTEKAIGKLDSNDTSSLILGGNVQLKYATFPEKVSLNFGDNEGETSNVQFDAIAQTMQSNELITINGPQGNLRGIGFYYSIKDEEFKIKSNISGEIIHPQSLQNMQRAPKP